MSGNGPATSNKAPLEVGVYLHIPFCSFMCHYCDFAKTARWDEAGALRYFQSLETHSRLWMSHLSENFPGLRVKSINIGGGTPSLFSHEYQKILRVFFEYLGSDSEISLEANPDDLSSENLKIWKSLGFNRLSVGIQSFRDEGLHFLKRTHNQKQALSGLRKASGYFPNLNVDLIYAWPGQTMQQWRQDLSLSLESGARHLSLYNLTFAPGTPVGRAKQRGKISEEPEEFQVKLYQEACLILKSHGFIHDEVSNWSLPGYSCLHNWLYWQGGYYLGIGSGAHGYLPLGSEVGLRYQYPASDRLLREASPEFLTDISGLFHLHLANSGPPGLLQTEERNRDSWLLEYLGCGLRSRKGISLSQIKKITGKSFMPTALVSDALKQKILVLREENLTLDSSEWFRETAWSLSISECF